MVTEPFLPRQSSGVRPDKTTQGQGKGGPVSFLRVYENVDRDYVVTIAAGYLLNGHLALMRRTVPIPSPSCLAPDALNDPPTGETGPQAGRG